MFPRTILFPGTKVSTAAHRAFYQPSVPSSIFVLWWEIELPLQ
jgi:hypothetical protein